MRCENALLRSLLRNVCPPLAASIFLVNGIAIRLDETEWNLRWFLCPSCRRRCRFVYLPDLACRRCCGLDWSSRHRSRTVPGLHRIRWLRQKIGADPRPFSSLPKRPAFVIEVNIEPMADQARRNAVENTAEDEAAMVVTSTRASS